MSLREKQSLFARKVAELIAYIYSQGYEVTLGDAWAKEGHKKDSLHYNRLAIDLNLFLNGKYLKTTEDHRFAGEYWKALHPVCVWGGEWQDGNHYQFGTG